MTDAWSRRARAAWRFGPVLAAAVGATLVVRALVAGRRRAVPPHRPAGYAHPGSSAVDVGAPAIDGAPRPGVLPASGRDTARPTAPDEGREAGGLRDQDDHEHAPGRRVLGLTVTASVVAVVVAAFIARGVVGGSEPGGVEDGAQARHNQPAGPTTTTTATTTATVDPPSPAEVFALASRRLESAGSFAYSGTVHATDVSHIRPGHWLATEVTVDGEVALSSDRLHEIASGVSGVTETVAEGSTVWGRSASDRPQLATETYQVVTGLTSDPLPRVGATLLPDWLRSATSHRATGADASNRGTFSATVPAEGFGEIVRGQGRVAAEVLLTLDAAGDPARVEVTSVSGGTLRLVLDISNIGDDVIIDLPVE